MKIICIGECSLNIILGHDGKPRGSMPGGRIANAAAIMARNKAEVLMASEASADAVGDTVVRFLADAGVDINSVDRFTEGRTALNVFVLPAEGADNASPSLTRYEQYSSEAFDIIWPRISAGDIVLFGGFYAIDPRMRPRMQRLLAYAAEQKAVLVYLPGFLPQQEPRITRVMPQILENLEAADLVVTRDRDLSLIFGVDSGQTCYHNRIDFYCRSLVNIDAACAHIAYYSGKEMSCVDIDPRICSTLLWNAGAVAGIVQTLAERHVAPDQLEAPAADFRQALLEAAALSANARARDISDEWQLIS